MLYFFLTSLTYKITFYLNFSNKRIGVLAIKLGSLPQWTKKGEKFYATVLQVVFKKKKVTNYCFKD